MGPPVAGPLCSLLFGVIFVAETITALPFTNESSRDNIPTDVCSVHRCRPGRVCRPTSDGGFTCDCAPAGYCLGHSNNVQVCGSDRIWYASHCELHRTACITGLHLHVEQNQVHCHDVTKDQQQDLEEITIKKDEDFTLQPVAETTLSTLIPTASSVCPDHEYKLLTTRLVDYHCFRIGYNSCLNSSREYQLAGVIIFHYYDKNSDEKLDITELGEVEDRAELPCRVTDLVLLFDQDNDSSLSLSEFKLAINMPTISLDEELALFRTTVTAGSGLEVKCSVQGVDRLVWTRNGLILNASNSAEFTMYDDGSLYIHEVALHHAGNYTCSHPDWNDVKQTHVINVRMAPLVRVSPSTQVHSSDGVATLQCYTFARPTPSVEWQFNEQSLESVNRWRYLLLDDNRTLVIHGLNYPADTGAYKCHAQNEAGSSQDIATVFVEQSRAANDGFVNDPYEAFIAFHDDGYTTYEPSRCRDYRHVAAEFKLLSYPGRSSRTPTTWRQLCPGDASRCAWGDAVNVRNKFIYASQPEWNRLVVIDIRDHHTPVQLIDTDQRPVELIYFEPLDQLLVVCWGQQDNLLTAGTRTIVVVHQASDEKRHSVVHVWPTDGLQINGSIGRLFVPPFGDLGQFGSVFHGYATVIGQQQLVKLELKSSKYSEVIDLSMFNCRPLDGTFIAVGGRLVIQCASETTNKRCVILDYVTDHVMACSAEMSGDIYVSPDVKYLLVVNNSQSLMSVYSLDIYGWTPQKMFDVNVGVELSSVRFVTPSAEESSKTYDVLATAANQDAIVHVELDTGRLSIVEGADWYVGTAIEPWTDAFNHIRYLTPSGEFGYQLMTRGISSDSVTVVDSRERRIQCSWQNVSQPTVAVWIEPLRL